MQDLDMNTRKAMSEAIAVLDAPGSQGVGRTMYLKTRWTKVEEPSRSGRLLSRAGGQDTCKRVYLDPGFLATWGPVLRSLSLGKIQLDSKILHN